MYSDRINKNIKLNFVNLNWVMLILLQFKLLIILKLMTIIMLHKDMHKSYLKQRKGKSHLKNYWMVNPKLNKIITSFK